MRQNLKKLQLLRDIDAAAAYGLIARDPKVLCRAFIQTFTKCENVNNNMAETFNGWICSARMMPIVDMLKDMQSALMERMKIKRDMMVNSHDALCPRIRSKVEILKWESRFCVAKPAVNDKFQVKNGDEQYVVDLKAKACACQI